MKQKLFALTLSLFSFLVLATEPVRVAFKSRDNTDLSALLFKAENPKALLLVVHGMQSNAEWFRSSGKFLSEKGVSVLAFDRRGSGKSGGLPGHADKPQDFIDDIHAAYYSLIKHGGDAKAPVHLYANCFGSRVAFPYAALRPEAFRSIIVTSPATDMSKEADYSLGEKLKILTTPNKLRYFATPLVDEHFSTHWEVLRWIGNDEKSLSVRFVTKSFLSSARTLTGSMYDAVKKLEVPLYVILADKDRVVNNAKIEARFEKNYQGELKIETLCSEHLLEMGESYQSYQAKMLEWIEQHS
jgi:alpha-beta hydrolase superfamily lysophospholipase